VAAVIELGDGLYDPNDLVIPLSVPQRRAADLSRGALGDKTEDEKTFKILSRVIEGKQDRTRIVTSVVDGVSYPQELHNSNAKFVLQNGIEESE